MERGDVAAIEAIARDGGTLAGEGATTLRGLGEFIDRLRTTEQLEPWLERCRDAKLIERVTFLGLVDHAVLKDLWPNCELSIVPSILAEAFGMVAAEAAACGCVPVVSDHSGLADAAVVIERGDVTPIRVDFADDALLVPRLTDVLNRRLALTPEELARQAAAARANVAAEWGWNHLAAIVADLMTGGRLARCC
jgi:glycosyltransferase involved in cell wall biosynthesis